MPDFPIPDDFRPVEVERPPYLHRYELSSPKLDRRLTLFSWSAVLLWTMIESHAGIARFCERPGLVRFKGDWRLADFWVQRQEHSEFLFLEDSPRLEMLVTAPRLDSDLGQRVRTISNDDLQANDLWIRNWLQMLPYLASNRRLVEQRQLDRSSTTAPRRRCSWKSRARSCQAMRSLRAPACSSSPVKAACSQRICIVSPLDRAVGS